VQAPKLRRNRDLQVLDDLLTVVVVVPQLQWEPGRDQIPAQLVDKPGLVVRQRQQRQLRDRRGHDSTTARPLPRLPRPLLNASNLACHASVAAIAASIFRRESGCSLAICSPARDGRRRAFSTCRVNANDPSCVSSPDSTATWNNSNARTTACGLFIHHSIG